jgi:hypothetical protein
MEYKPKKAFIKLKSRKSRQLLTLFPQILALIKEIPMSHRTQQSPTLSKRIEALYLLESVMTILMIFLRSTLKLGMISPLQEECQLAQQPTLVNY